MEREVSDWTLGELAEKLGGELRGPADLLIRGPAEAGSGNHDELTFAGESKFLELAEGSEVGAVLVTRGMSCAKPCIGVDNPRRAFAEFLSLCARPLPIQNGIHSAALVDPRASVDPNASIGAFAVIERNAQVGSGCRVYPFCYVGEGCTLAEGVILYPHVVLYQDVCIGARSIIHSGTVLGADGFGFEWDGIKHAKIPQVGRVVIGADTEIGSLTAVDRAMIGATSIGDDTKIDNLVQIGHNNSVGDHTLIASQTGIGGSSRIGSHVIMGGQVGVSDHTTIGDGIALAARSASTQDMTKPGLYKGFPAEPIAFAQRLTILTRRLPELAKTVKDLEARIAELESKLE